MPDTNRRTTVLKRLRDSIGAARGATAAEYIIMLVLAALVVLILNRVFGGTLRGKVATAQQEIALVDSPRASGRSGSGSTQADSMQAGGSHADGATGRASAQSDGARSANASQAAANVSYEQAERPVAATGSVGGINPFILLVVLGLVGLLIYVFFAKKSD